MNPLTINDKIYGKFKITEPVLIELIKSKPVQRLKKIDQHGTQSISRPEFKIINRFEHSLGVMLLLRKFNASLEEQIAGLLHDISHTAFSHVVDFVFDDTKADNFHERHVHYIIKKSSIPGILKRYNLTADYVTDEKNFPLLELPEPNICADRLDYFLRDSHICYGFMDQRQLKKISQDLKVINGKWAFVSQSTAKFTAKKFIYTARHGWYHPQNQMGFIILGKIIKDVLKRKLINKKDLFTDDKIFIKKLNKLKDQKVNKGLYLLKNFEAKINYKNYDHVGHWKFRAIDPYVLKGNKLIRLSRLDQDFKKYFNNFKKEIKKGTPMKIVKS